MKERDPSQPTQPGRNTHSTQDSISIPPKQRPIGLFILAVDCSITPLRVISELDTFSAEYDAAPRNAGYQLARMLYTATWAVGLGGSSFAARRFLSTIDPSRVEMTSEGYVEQDGLGAGSNWRPPLAEAPTNRPEGAESPEDSF